ncbi:MAG: hypothetical protein A4E61_00488 [Syntrophorhabdus sp. PtaB.Bin184]|nr:MAG: hypothetical protein A4E61_00488 [Syntrophorhabdus sp. PtaB.Bin184]
MLAERTIVDRIEVLPESGAIQVRQRNQILRVEDVLDEDGKVTGTTEEEVSFTFHRYVLEKGADLEGQPENVKAVAEATWSLQLQ